jgi:hypothetical protein
MRRSPLALRPYGRTFPAVPSCNQGCVLNDLDLSSLKMQWALFPTDLYSGWIVNNVERVRIEDPTDGAIYVIHVRGSTTAAAGLLPLQDAFPKKTTIVTCSH